MAMVALNVFMNYNPIFKGKGQKAGVTAGLKINRIMMVRKEKRNTRGAYWPTVTNRAYPW